MNNITRSLSYTYLPTISDVSPTDVKFKKVKEAEGFHKPQQLSPLLEEEDLNNKNGGLWQCISRTPQKSGGYIYRFKLKPQYDEVTPSQEKHRDEHKEASREKNRALFPGAELSGMGVRELFNPLLSLDRLVDEKVAMESLAQMAFDFATKDDNMTWAAIEERSAKLAESRDRNKIEQALRKKMEPDLEQIEGLKQLGYACNSTTDGVYLNLPDREVLLTRWDGLRETRPELPQLNILSSEGIADDISFIQAFCTHDALLSSGAEFVHDHLAHLIPVIKLMLSSNPTAYERRKFEERYLVIKTFRRIMLAKSQGVSDEGKFEAALAALTDLTTATYPGNLNEVTRDSHFKTIWTATNWDEYWKRRYETIDPSSLALLWEQMGKIEEKFDELRKLKREQENSN